MKIGIVTQPLGGNYGGILQNYALQKVLKALGHEPITIDYMWNLNNSRYILTIIKTLSLYPFKKYRRKFVRRYPVRTNKVIDDFINRYISKSDYLYAYPPSIIDDYNIEAIITGSDQVWRPKYNRNLKDLYLDFAKKKKICKIAYAASFGTAEEEYSKIIINECKEAAEQLNAVSVREASGVYLFHKYFGIEATEVLDPTLLLKAEDYQELISLVPEKKHSFCAYILDKNFEIENLLRKNFEGIDYETLQIISQNDKEISPIDWIAFIRDSKYIITDSFHCTVFAIIFQKPFISICNFSRGADRFISLLEPLGLGSRIIFDFNQDVRSTINQPIEWDKISQIINKKREFSINFLKENLTTIVGNDCAKN